MKLSGKFVRSVVLLFCLMIITSLGLSSCNIPNLSEPPPLPTEVEIPKEIPTPISSEGLGLDDYSPPLVPPITEVSFSVKIPDNSAEVNAVYFVLRDEVTGLAINAQSYPMEPEMRPDGKFFTLTLSFPLGSVLKYRYEKQGESVPIAEHNSDGSAVRYRLYHVEGPGSVEDVVSRWTDTTFEAIPGRILGKVIEADTGLPVPNLLAVAGGAQTLTASDGSFLLEGLPPGIHNLVILSLDGAYRTFQQGARIASDSSTPAEIAIQKAPLVDVAFVVQLPENTPPIIPIRIAGSLYQFGNTFANLSGGISSLASNMPILTSLADGRYITFLKLPAGADLQYKYTLGDGFWNAEHSIVGDFRLRQLIVPETNTVVVDIVETWLDGNKGPITFDVTTPANTPLDEVISIQFNPVFGWTIPLPMWELGENRWAYILFSPLNLPGELQYRFCRNGQCNRTDDIRTTGERSPGFVVNITEQDQTIIDNILTWSMLPDPIPETLIITPTLKIDPTRTLPGIELEAAYHPSYRSLLPYTFSRLERLGASLLVITPTWTYTQQNPPVLQPISGQDATWFDLTEMIQLGSDFGFQTALFPVPHSDLPIDEWWISATRDFSWWLVWFDHYQKFILHHADLAQLSGSNSLIIGGDWVVPSLPSASLPGGVSSGVPSDSENRWREFISNIRARYSGNIIWALTLEQANNPPGFIDAVDGVYILWDGPLSTNPEATTEELTANASTILDTTIKPILEKYNKPIIIGITYPSAQGSLSGCVLTITGDCIDNSKITTMNPEIFNLSLDLQEQIDAYSAILSQVQARDWIIGLVSRGYYPPAILVDPSQSVNGKPVENLFQLWFHPAP